MTRNIGEPCMCGDPACWVCGEGSAYDGDDRAVGAYNPERDAATVSPADALHQMAEASAWGLTGDGSIQCGEWYEVLHRALLHASTAQRAAEERAAGAEAAAADLRARVDALTAEAAAGAAVVWQLNLRAGNGNPWWYDEYSDCCICCMADAFDWRIIAHDDNCAAVAYDLSAAPATHSGLGELGHCVDRFAHAMKEKLADRARAGYTGWDDPDLRRSIVASMIGHAQRGPGQRVDVANLAMMLWHQEGEPSAVKTDATAPATTAATAGEVPHV